MASQECGRKMLDEGIGIAGGTYRRTPENRQTTHGDEYLRCHAIALP
jgi:hypothetical protein